MMSKEINTAESRFFAEVSQLLEKARSKTYQSVNTIMVETYWQVGRHIVAQEAHGNTRAAYGTQLIARLSKHLSDSFGKGFSELLIYSSR